MRKFRDLMEAKDTDVFAYGRFSPPTTGHEKLIQMKKKLNKMKSMSQGKAKQKAQKAVRNLIKQKTVGKSKDLATMSLGQKASLEKKVDKKMKAMGGKVQTLVKKFQKKIVKKHRADKKAAREKK